jgi:hypothetical protein
VVQTAKALGAVVNRGIVWVVSFFGLRLKLTSKRCENS